MNRQHNIKQNKFKYKRVQYIIEITVEKEIIQECNMSHVKFDEETKVWTSCDNYSVPVYNPKISMSHIVMRALELHGPKCAQVIRNYSLSESKKKLIEFETIK